MKKIIILIIALCLTGCSNSKVDKTKDKESTTTKNTDTKEVVAAGYREGDNVWEIPVTGDLMMDISDPKVVWEDADIVALITVDSIDGGDNFSKVANGYCFPYTYGKMTVQEVYKGDIKVGGQFVYYRSGGTVSYDKYYNALLPAEKEKIAAAKAEGYIEEREYVKTKMSDDIDIEVGTTYIAYLAPDTFVDGKKGGYFICNGQGGMRKVQGNPKVRSKMQVYNNFTNEWDTIESIIINE